MVSAVFKNSRKYTSRLWVCQLSKIQISATATPVKITNNFSNQGTNCLASQSGRASLPAAHAQQKIQISLRTALAGQGWQSSLATAPRHQQTDCRPVQSHLRPQVPLQHWCWTVSVGKQVCVCVCFLEMSWFKVLTLCWIQTNRTTTIWWRTITHMQS